MDSDTKKKLIIGASIGAALIAAIFIKNKIEQTKFKPISKDIVMQILKKSRKQNFALLKQVSVMATQIAAQMQINKIDPQMIKGYLESSESPLKVAEIFEKNYTTVCSNCGVSYANFNQSVEYYIKNGDKDIENLVKECENDYEVSLSGKLPQMKVSVPSNLTKERLVEIQKKLTLKRYLVQTDIFRKLRGKTQQQLMSNPELMRGLTNPEEEEEKILQEQGLGSNDEPSTAVFAAAVSQFRNDAGFKDSLIKIENHYSKIFNKYRAKMQSNKITQEELNQLEDELIYAQA